MVPKRTCDCREAPHAPGSVQHALDSLRMPGSFLAPLTERLLMEAGLRPGMRVLDVGCGSGEVALLAARIVGPQGWVVGVDCDRGPLEAALERADAMGLRNVEFCPGDASGRPADLFAGPTVLGPEARFDAVVGRMVLMHLRDPAAAIKRLRRRVRPGGFLAFQELDCPVSPLSLPPLELFERACGWILDALRAAGADLEAGLKLRSWLLAAGLPSFSLRVSGCVHADADSPVFGRLADTVRSLLPLILATGAATADQVCVESLAARMSAEARRAHARVQAPDLVGAWAPVPAR
ncbi:MAG TPA: class I SAM-dependent methyltransferase [Longimicrobium sp.]|nr:class I SAM-dependent methyltransferase [Longimicrobium sp.]